MRRITAALAALALTTGVLSGTTAAASAESGPAGKCVGSSLAMYATTQLCVVERTYPAITQPAT
ncbi:hypothetical protein [Amycolatopsis sp. MtRt-6]|uniref:hypothetical protein n=1 Tax=Amycolatopsis sp. MtRt-6 TaxID=2792782 RepID=UPI001A8C02E5|nr:hypothetical protein [Amycolatopsis sp. MtRt-6]